MSISLPSCVTFFFLLYSRCVQRHTLHVQFPFPIVSKNTFCYLWQVKHSEVEPRQAEALKQVAAVRVNPGELRRDKFQFLSFQTLQARA